MVISAPAGSCRGSELNSTRDLAYSKAISFVVYTCIHYKLFACESEPVFIYMHHIPVSIRRHKDGIMRDLVAD